MGGSLEYGISLYALQKVENYKCCTVDLLLSYGKCSKAAAISMLPIERVLNTDVLCILSSVYESYY